MSGIESPVLAAIIGGGASVGSSLLSRGAQGKATDVAAKEIEERIKKQNEAWVQIKPLAEALISLGLDPEKFMKSPLGQSILGQQQQGISQSYAGARGNLTENLAQMGMAGSGVNAGPLANLFNQEALAQANARQQTAQMGLNLGLQGANIFQGQQAVFNPSGLTSSLFAPNYNADMVKNLLGALGPALANIVANKTTSSPFALAPPLTDFSALFNPPPATDLTGLMRGGSS